MIQQCFAETTGTASQFVETTMEKQLVAHGATCKIKNTRNALCMVFSNTSLRTTGGPMASKLN